ncbi:RHS repeat domain-containing protein [Paenibacillus elgii]|uniref:RHS repeat domain-containing protein n=1 Tax=Paenibacillus elgii TaxID=189691 RepID=UPI000248D7B3|nr:RHS repeat-associated core domain-containing protein [Paenibacillus elgii]
MVNFYMWDGNTILHEWKTEKAKNKPGLTSEQLRQALHFDSLITWVFEDGTFHPLAKFTSESSYGIVSDYLGTPIEMYDETGEKVWSCDLDIYGKVQRQDLTGNRCACPFRYPGQYEDEETGLYYNRFRYYSPHEGMYTQQDPIGLAGNNPTLYGYVHDPLTWIDPWGLINLNSNNAKGKFGVYKIEIKGELHKYGKADLSRVTQETGLPTRLHQQVRKLKEIFGRKNVIGEVIEKGYETTKKAKAAETAKLNEYYEQTGKVPEGNRRSFKPKEGCKKLK